MFRPLLGCAMLVSLLAVSAYGEQFKGKVKNVAADKDQLMVTVGKYDKVFTLPAGAKVLSATGKELPQGLKTKLFQPGAQVVVTTDTVDGVDVVKEVKLLESFPQAGFLDASEAGPDFLIQGEYEGTISGKGKLGAQVVAGGEGQFAVVILQGGLPGAGWDGKDVEKATAKTDGSKTTLAGSSWNGVLADGKLTGKTPDGAAFDLTRVVRHSSTEGAKPPVGAIVLFDGANVDEWMGGQLVEGKYLLAGGRTKRPVQDFTLHAEFRLPFRDRAQGNSGVYMQERYEMQIMNTFGRFPPPNNGMASIYTFTAPAVNMSYPPLSWQTYDIDFKAPKFDNAGKKTANARVTLLHNGVKVHNDAEIKTKTGAGKEEGPNALPIYFQNHGSAVHFRNVWLVLPSGS